MSEGKKSSGSFGSKIKAFWTENEAKIVTLFGLVLVAIIAFEFGTLQGQKWQNKPLIIEKMVQTCLSPETVQNPVQGQNLASGKALVTAPKDCALVGSKNSNKYHLPTCQWAKRIKPENVICFKSVEDAVAKNYQPDKNCIK